jgi:ferredoxin--NADP+ reductase
LCAWGRPFANMSAFLEERVLSVHHWTDRLFSFTTTRDQALRFSNGHFTMIGLRQENGKPLLRAYSIASANYEEHLEFLSIKVPDGPLTSKLQHIQVGDTIIVGRKPTGTLLIDYLLPAKNLYLMGTGTGLAPWMSIIRDPETYEKFEKVVVVHGVRQVNELAYRDYITQELPNHEFLGDIVRGKLEYYPTVTREPFERQGRIPDLVQSGQMARELGLPQLNPDTDRVMICGSPAMLRDLKAMCEHLGFKEGNTSTPGDFVIERAFAES